MHNLLKIVFMILLGFAEVQAQQIQASSKLDTNKIMIGDQVRLILEVSHPKNKIVNFPVVPDSITKVEILKRSKIDTVVSVDSSRITRKQTIVITCFDSGHFVLPPFRFVVGKDTANAAETEALLLSVYAPEVDTTKAIKEIKSPLDVPFSLKEAMPYIIGGAILLAIIGGLIYYFVTRKKKPVAIEEVKIPARPSHEIALGALRELESEKVWQTMDNGSKLYHSRISDIVRTYIETRYKIPAMELTTDEILNNFKRSGMKAEQKEKLQQLLQLSDLVKFAKAMPLPNEHELSLANAIDFITISIPQVKEDERKEGEV